MKPPTLKIGSLITDSPVLLAPMAGYTELPFRLICRRYGAGLVYTELISVEGIVRHARQTEPYLHSDSRERPVAAHLYGHDPDTFAGAAARVVSLNCFDAIDINAGCPVPKVVRRGAGAGLVKTPERLHAIVRAVRAAAPDMPMSVKTRIGPSPNRPNALELLRAVEEGGADAVAFHARYTSDRHSGPAHWDVLANIKQAARIPVIGNGGVKSAEDAMAMFAQTRVDGIMIGRAAMGNPWLFAQCNAALRGKTLAPPAWEERRAVLLEHLRGLIAFTELSNTHRKRKKNDPEEMAVRHFRAHLIRYLTGCRGLTEVKRGLTGLHSLRDVEAALKVIEGHAGPSADA